MIGGKRRIVSGALQRTFHSNSEQFSPAVCKGVYFVGKLMTSFLFRAIEDFIYVFIRPFLPGTY